MPLSSYLIARHSIHRLRLFDQNCQPSLEQKEPPSSYSEVRPNQSPQTKDEPSLHSAH